MFLEQEFVIYHDNGEVDFINDMYTYVWNFGGVNRFYGSMKFNLGAYNTKKSQHFGSWFNPKAFEHDTGFFLFVNGKMVSPDLFIGEWHIYEKYVWSKRRSYSYTRRQYKPSHNTRNLKRIQNTPARRAACSVLKDEGEPPFRGARTKGNLPNFWDDVYSRASCSWKNCTKRKRQYKGS